MNFFLHKSILFKGIDKDKIEELVKGIEWYTKKFVKGEYIAFKGDLVDRYMIIIRGSIVTEMTKVNGKTLQVETLQPYQEVAPSFLFGDNNLFPVDVIAKENSEIFCIPKVELLKLLQRNEVILKNLLNSFSNKTQFLSKRLFFANKTIEEKLAIYILENMKDGIFSPKTSIKNLAEIFGVSRPSLSRVIGVWIDIGILSRLGAKSFKVEEPGSLKDFL